ncbi:MAG: hypothetical protein P8181_16530 [bacterium]
MLERAIELDPSFALPHAWLSDYYQSQGWWGSSRPHDVMPKSRAAAERAIELDDTVGLAHGSLAIVHYFYEWNVRAAEREFDRAAGLDPGSAWIHMCRSLFFSCHRRRDDVITEGRMALNLEPLDGLLAAWVASALVGVGEVEEAVSTIFKAIDMDQSHWHLQMFLGFAYLHSSREAQAAAALERAVDLSGGASITLAVLAVAYHVIGKKSEADRLAERLEERSKNEYVAPWLFALVSGVRGDKPAALAHLERAVEEHDLFIATANLWPPQAQLTGPEFDAILRRTGLR